MQPKSSEVISGAFYYKRIKVYFFVDNIANHSKNAKSFLKNTKEVYFNHDTRI